MADLTAGGAPVRRDSAGVLRETIEATTDNAAAMLPANEFTDAQREMARLPLPFRNLIRDPFLAEVAATAKTTAYPAEMATAIATKCSSFQVTNPNLCWVRFRGATNADDKCSEGQGRCIPPGFVGVYSTQNPQFLTTLPVARPGYPIPAEFAPLELNYGIGG